MESPRDGDDDDFVIVESEILEWEVVTAVTSETKITYLDAKILIADLLDTLIRELESWVMTPSKYQLLVSESRVIPRVVSVSIRLGKTVWESSPSLSPFPRSWYQVEPPPRDIREAFLTHAAFVEKLRSQPRFEILIEAGWYHQSQSMVGSEIRVMEASILSWWDYRAILSSREEGDLTHYKVKIPMRIVVIT